MTGVWRKACRITGKNDLVARQYHLLVPVDADNIPKEPYEADEFNENPRDGPFEKHQNTISPVSICYGTRTTRGQTYMPPKKQTVPRHFSLREKK